jgi:glucokinase
MAKRFAVGVDLGATRIRVCVGDESGKLFWRKSTQMPRPPRVEDYVDHLVGRVREGVENSPRKEDIAGIGVASIGPLDLHEGRMAFPSNLPYKTVPIVEPLKKAFGVRVVLMNDARTAALGERRFGAGRAHENLVYITISTGIGGGAIVDGHLLSGKDGNAGEIGHVTVDPQERLRCGCGRRGHWEAYCSGRNLPNLAKMLASKWRGDAVGIISEVKKADSGRPDSTGILRAAKEGDRFAEHVAMEMGKFNALGFANVINSYDPSLITVGGGVTLNNQELVLKPIRELVPEYAVNRPPPIVVTPLGDDVGLLGALTLALGDVT